MKYKNNLMRKPISINIICATESFKIRGYRHIKTYISSSFVLRLVKKAKENRLSISYSNILPFSKRKFLFIGTAGLPPAPWKECILFKFNGEFYNHENMRQLYYTVAKFNVSP